VSVLWLQPIAWFGLTLLAVPILIHLLARHRSRRVPFPSLKFIPASQLAAAHRRLIADWPLLVVRLTIAAAATAALAAPVIVSDARRASWDGRVARAVVLSDGDDAVEAAASEETRNVFAGATFSGLPVADAIGEATEWLRRQRPAARELVIAGVLRENALTTRDLEVVPPHIGIRFLPAGDNAQEVSFATEAVADSGDGLAGFQLRTTAAESRTEVAYREKAAPAPLPRIRVIASTDQQARADAMLRAVLRQGVSLTATSDRAIAVVFEGGDAAAQGARDLSPPSQPWMRDALARVPEARGGEHDGELIARVAIPATDPRAVSIVSRLVRASYADSFEDFEPRRMSPATLTAWSRPPGGSPPDVRPADEGDRRWFWGAALLLLGVEQWLRRRARRA
jgi:hypothetical protein